LAYENRASPSVIVYGWLWVGSIDVPLGKEGLSRFAASLLTRGTAHRTFADIGEQVESIGAALNIGSSGHTTRFTAKCLVEDLSLVIEILTDCLYHPIFPAEYVDKRRGEILTALEQQEHDTHAVAMRHFSELMYPRHPYGRSQLGYKETVEALTRDDVERFYRERYGSAGMTAILVGAVPPAQGLDLLAEAFGSWQGADYVQQPLPRAAPVGEKRTQQVLIPGKTQSDLILGWTGVRRTDPDFVPAYLANSVLGQFGMMGRVGQRVREDLGLAYYAYTNLDAGIGVGPWAVAAGVAPGKVDLAVEAILGEVERMRQEPVDAEELADNKAFIVDSLPLHLESNEGIAAQIAGMEQFGLGLDYLRRFPSLIAQISAGEMMDVAHRYLDPEAYVLSVAGPGIEQES
jgi:zinc protease